MQFYSFQFYISDKFSLKQTSDMRKNLIVLVKAVQTCHFLVFFSKGMLPAELQMLAEDPSEYTAPEDGNLVYKLFSLDDLLLLVRCTVQNAEIWPRSHKNQRIKKVKIAFLGIFFTCTRD